MFDHDICFFIVMLNLINYFLNHLLNEKIKNKYNIIIL